jgi:hypothetical protein
MTLEALRHAAADIGLTVRGGFHPPAGDGVPGTVATLVLLGLTGRHGWVRFLDSPEYRDGHADPLDRWSRRVVGALAESVGGVAFYPFGGPPFLPFGRWAARAEAVFPSPLGLLIHPDWGLWHSYRGALGFAQRLALPSPDSRPSPCIDCVDRPCLSACPVGAFGPAGYDVAACIGHLDRPEGAACRTAGCRARRACPVGSAAQHGPEQAAFHMQAFRRAQG